MYKHEIFKMTLLGDIQNSGLEIGTVYYILKDVFREVESTYNQFLQLNSQQQSTPETEDQDETTVLSDESEA